MIEKKTNEVVKLPDFVVTTCPEILIIQTEHIVYTSILSISSSVHISGGEGNVQQLSGCGRGLGPWLGHDKDPFYYFYR